jgi:hypothetical protein
VIVLAGVLFAALAGGSGDDDTTEVADVGSRSDLPAVTTTTFEATTSTTDPFDDTTTTTGSGLTTDGVLSSDLLSECGDTPARLVPGKAVAVLRCSDSYALVDMETSTVEHVQRATDTDDAAYPDAILGDRYVWWETVDIPARGLDPPSRQFTLRSRALDGSGDKQLVVLHGDQNASIGLAAAYGTRLISTEPGPPSTDGSFGTTSVVVRDVDGKEVLRIDDADGDDASEVFDGIYAVGDQLVDLSQGELVPADAAVNGSGDAQTTDTCAQAGLGGDELPYHIVRRGADGLKATGTAGTAGADTYPSAVAQGDHLLGQGNAGLTGYATDGSMLWELPSEVVNSWGVFGGMPFILNQSDEVVPVDPATGKETTVSDELLDAATVRLHGGRVAVDSSTGNVLLIDNAGDQPEARMVTVPECKVR